MTTLENPTIYVLEGLIRCRKCDTELLIRPSSDTGTPAYQCYSCADSEPARPLPAEQVERWIIQKVTDTVMTESYTEMLVQSLTAATATLSSDAVETLGHRERDPKWVRAMATDTFTFLMPKNAPDAKQFFSKLIDHIALGDQEAVVHYARPLPEESALPGAYQQSLLLPHDGTC